MSLTAWSGVIVTLAGLILFVGGIRDRPRPVAASSAGGQEKPQRSSLVMFLDDVIPHAWDLVFGKSDESRASPRWRAAAGFILLIPGITLLLVAGFPFLF